MSFSILVDFPPFSNPWLNFPSPICDPLKLNDLVSKILTNAPPPSITISFSTCCLTFCVLEFFFFFLITHIKLCKGNAGFFAFLYSIKICTRKFLRSFSLPYCQKFLLLSFFTYIDPQLKYKNGWELEEVWEAKGSGKYHNYLSECWLRAKEAQNR